MIPARSTPAAFSAAALLLATLLSACAAPAETPTLAPAEVATPTDMEIALTPRRPTGDKVETIDVTLTIREPALAAGDTFLSMAIVRVMAPGALNRPETLIAEDAAGPLPLTIEEDPVDPSDFRQDRRWLAARATQGDVTVRYTIEPRVITSATRPGPLIDTRTELTGFYGSGNTMLALPVSGWPREVALDWNLEDLTPGARAASSLGEGDVTATVTAQNLNNSFFFAGPLRSQPEDGAGDFAIYWITPAAFDLDGAAAWTQEAYAYFNGFFGASDTPFRVFMRTTERFQGGGGGGFNSFIFGTVEGEDRDPDEVRGLLAHEALHHFVGGYGDGGGAGGQQWYSEGVTNYYTVVLPYRAGLTSLEHYINDFNGYAKSYYTNPQSNLSNTEVTRLFFADGNAQIVPYNRGPLYVALTDARIRAASGGALRVDNLIFDFIDAQKGAEDGVALWHDLAEVYLGEEGGAEFRAMMEGAPLDLPSDLFGPCFVAEDQMLQNFVVGFRPYKDEDGRTRAGPIVPGTAAEAAGVARYDIITNPEALEAAETAAPGTPLTLNLQRDTETLSRTYTPWTSPTPGKQWVRTQVPETDCNL
ncbi:putative lipoprotein [Hyphomonas neptunium ATCC 15444]|uniref:Putative lipoprotein n=2 Tax=Hyphomonas TaxID=85 RepID=Q0BZ06_HYPNA|nr:MULTISPECIES: lipoprotein [Hyphomonas]ABI78736.1 putative lipoprotein [Hyphomonas neptunium ATCC 15444]KCZ87282.1 putative lipoprotein [Hyphomonas hirschiana VP5]